MGEVIFLAAAAAAMPVLVNGPAQPARPVTTAADCTARAGDDPHGSPPKEPDDHARLQVLTDKAAKLMKAGKTTAFADLARQLSRKQCTVSLPKPATKPLTAAQIYRQRLGGVLIVASVHKCEKCSKWHATAGGGFVISETGVVVTNYHLFRHKDRKTLVAMNHDGKVFPVKQVLAASQADDVAILQLDTGKAKFAPIALARDASVGEEVTVISHPAHRFYSLTKGIVSRYFTKTRNRARVPTMSITADYAWGSSGGPVMDKHGNAVGLVAATVSIYYTQTKKKDNLQMVFKDCVPASAVLKLIKR